MADRKNNSVSERGPGRQLSSCAGEKDHVFGTIIMTHLFITRAC